MGGAGYIFTGEHDADLMTNSAKINLNLLNSISKINLMNNINKTKIFYSSSACIYPEYNQMDASSLNCEESSAYPAAPDSEYGWEKLFSERLYLAYSKNHKIPIAIARYHNIFGPESTFTGGREKAPAAICRKIIETSGKIEIWGDGQQTRSFLYIDECIEGTRRLMSSNYQEPVNIGSDEMISINELVNMISSYSNKEIIIEHIDGPTGVRCRNSDNKLIYSKIGWEPTMGLEEGIKKTYDWIKNVYSKTS
jgi:nucleoside-diphosphate-sugar epimerase